MSEVNTISKTDSTALKQRLAGLSTDQRAMLIRRLDGEKSETISSVKLPATIPKGRPLRVEEHPRVKVFPASPGQQRMWFLHHYAPESPVYCVPSAFHLVGPLNVAWLEAAFDAVIQRHDMLRTTFAMENGELFQHVAAASTFRLQQINLEAIPADIRNAAAERSLAEETCRPFDLAAGPPFRSVLVRLRSTEHVLLLVLHHIISDGWSRSNFYRELSAAYAALAAGRPVPMSELPVQFADYSAWQKDWLNGGALAAQTAYWKTKLAGEPEPLDLPSDRARPATESFRGGRCSMRLDPQLTAALKTRAQEEGATLFMILLAAFKTLLHHYTGHDDLIVGVPIANRQRVEMEGLIGFFANTLVMRTTFPDDLTFRELLRRVKETAVEAYANQDMPFERLVELLQVRRDASRTPLFQATFALLDYPAVVFQLPGIQTVPWFVTTHTSKFDFSLTLERSADGWTAVAEYSTDLFDAGRVERMLEHWRVILESIVTNPDQRVSEISLLTTAERRQILEEWNAPRTDYPEAKCVHEWFEAQAARTPEAVAVVFEEHRLTYAELNRRANQLAHRLRKLGVQPDALVGICVERSLELVVGILGILKAGGAYLPLDPAYPKERLAFMLDDARPKVVLTQQRLINSLSKNAAQLIALDLSGTFGAESLENPGCSPQLDHLAYVIYTSGSTGKPKGTLVTHKNVARLFQATEDWFHFGPEDVWTLFHSHAFDFSVWEMWGALGYGGRLVVVPYWVSRAPDDFYQLLKQERVTVLNQTPSAFRQLIQAEASAGRGQELALRLVIFGGEALEMPSLKPWFERHGDQHPQLVNMYGITETTVHVTCRPLTTADLKSGSVVGIPLPDLQVYILDQHRQLLPVGVPGEIYVGGAGVARGYLNRPELTGERFTGNPFSCEPGARLYRSGDLARYLPNGDIEYLGRIDHQVKLRGFRIELGEIETALRARPEVREAVVIVREDTLGDQRLVAYLVARAGAKPDASTLRTRLAETLPEYMLPNAFVWLDQLPLTPNGKVDRKAMPAPETNIGVTSGDRDQPANLLELELIRLWRRLFQRENIGRHDNFFDLGGHSLLAARLATEINKLLGCKLPIAFLFQSPTVESLTRRLTGENWAPPWSSLVPLQPMGSEPPVFCVHGIGGDVYGFLDLARELAPDRPVYGLQAVGLDGRQPRHTTVEEMAAHYAREIRSLQPEGPYHLVGTSLGGWIAYAVAQELTRQGSKVALLGLLDTRATSDVPWTLYARVMAPYLADRLRFHFKKFLSGPKEGRLRYLRQKINRLRIHITRSRGNLPVRQTATDPTPAHAQDMMIDYFDAVATRYRPAKYAEDVTLFAGGDAKYFQHSTFWKHLVLGRVQVQRVAGGHGSIISEVHAAKFALIFKQALREAEAAAGWSSARK
ncbi:MAG TPA: amino acid adenylation domain-containing protein [Candidatus Limnocylindrales bacterium]|nr:amino acid adenylation domain-containing protein [Candidatus Limnocylindrales bacterium]